MTIELGRLSGPVAQWARTPIMETTPLKQPNEWKRESNCFGGPDGNKSALMVGHKALLSSLEDLQCQNKVRIKKPVY